MALPTIIRRPLAAMGFLSEEAAPSAAPIRESSPEDDNAEPLTDALVTRSDNFSLVPASYMKFLLSNDDKILRKGGKGLKLYDDLLDDDVAMSAMQQRRLAITSKDWEVAPGNKDNPLSVRAADDFRAMVKALDFDRVTGGLHYSVWYGYGVGECMWTTKVHDGRTIIWLDDIVVPDRRWFGFTVDGELRQVGVWTSDALNGESLPDNKFLTVRTGASHDFAFYGLGLAHWAYWPIFFKRAAVRVWMMFLEKMGQPTSVIEFPEEAANDPKKKAEYLKMAVSVGKDSAAAVPWNMLKDDRVKMIEATRSASGSSGYKEFMEAQDDALLRVVLGQPGTSKATPGGLGGDGQAKKDEGVKAEIVKADSDLISSALARTAAKWVTRWNYGPDVEPPTCYRVLDDPEDLSAIATRDVQLNGIGIKRTKESVSEVYGDGYELTPPVDPVEQAAKIAAITAGAKPPAAANDPAASAKDKAKARAAQFAAEYGVDDKAPLYVRRDLLNSAELGAWAKENGITSLVPDMHVTELYSKTPVDWFDMGQAWNEDDQGRILVGPGGPRSIERFGDAVVLRFYSRDIQYRHDDMIERGGSHDFDTFAMHVALSYDVPADFDLGSIKEPYAGELRFGPEVFEPIKEKGFDPATLKFSAEDEDAIDRLTSSLIKEGNPVFAAMAEHLRGHLQGVTTLEGARIALLDATEQLPVERLAKLIALPLLAERGAATIGAEDELSA